MAQPGDILVKSDGTLHWRGKVFHCILGRGGVIKYKHEGDGCTPEGSFPLRRVFYRPDRLEPPQCALPVMPIGRNDGWCDAPDSPLYNKLVALPFPESHENLWREDHLYDLVVTIGYNDDPVISGKGSAIFIHVCNPEGAPTKGCVALALKDLQEIVSGLESGSKITIEK